MFGQGRIWHNVCPDGCETNCAFLRECFCSFQSVTRASPESCNIDGATSYPQPTAAFSPQSKQQLRDAVKNCIKSSRIGDCSGGPHGSIGDWDVSAVTHMGEIFSHASAFNQGLSKWNVSKVVNMAYMFYRACAFNQDLSKWDVSSATKMASMFHDACTFNQDLSNWDVSAVTDMTYMFYSASSFKRELCGVAWMNSRADKTDMFHASPGSIASAVCTTTTNGYGHGCI